VKVVDAVNDCVVAEVVPITGFTTGPIIPPFAIARTSD
jgi:hypothetical protein